MNSCCVLSRQCGADTAGGDDGRVFDREAYDCAGPVVSELAELGRGTYFM